MPDPAVFIKIIGNQYFVVIQEHSPGVSKITTATIIAYHKFLCGLEIGTFCIQYFSTDPEGFMPVSIHQQYPRSEEHTSELQSLMRISYAVFCLKNKI